MIVDDLVQSGGTLIECQVRMHGALVQMKIFIKSHFGTNFDVKKFLVSFCCMRICLWRESDDESIMRIQLENSSCEIDDRQTINYVSSPLFLAVSK